MTKKASPRPERNHKVVKQFVRTLEAVNATRRKMEAAKKAVDYASALCEKHPKPETLAASKLAFNDYIKAVDKFSDAVRAYEKARVQSTLADSTYHRQDVRYQVAKAKNRAIKSANA